jgi:hypothetical protein
MGKSKRTRKLVPALGFGQSKQPQVRNINQLTKKVEQKLLAKYLSEAQSQAPFDANSQHWVCSFGNDYLGVDTLAGCLDAIALEDTERDIAYKECLAVGYATNQDETWSIQWNPKRAEHLKKVYSFEIKPNGSLYVAP